MSRQVPAYVTLTLQFFCFRFYVTPQQVATDKTVIAVLQFFMF